MIEGKVITRFNDGKDNSKRYEEGSIFRAEEKRYNDLKARGFVGEGKEVKETTKADK